MLPAHCAHPVVFLVALLIDRVFGEPPAIVHPVVWIRPLIHTLEGFSPEPGHRKAALVYGGIVAALLAGLGASIGLGATRLLARLPAPLALLGEAWLLKTAFSIRALVDAGATVEAHLRANDLDGAREALHSLVSRDVSNLNAEQVTSAAVESLAENTADSIVAPLCYYAIGGLPAAFAYRATNSLDAMIGYHGEYEYLGKAAARLDDLLNLLPSRVSGLLLLGAGAIVGGDLPGGWRTMLADHARTESPNAGWPMAAMAGLLGSRLEKRGHYVLGAELPAPDIAATDHAGEIVKWTAGAAVLLAMLLRWLVTRGCWTRSTGR